MALTQFDCPHCAGVFQAENPAAGQAVTCPRCGTAVRLPDELPPPAPDSDSPWAIGEIPASDSSDTVTESTDPFIPFDFRGDVPNSARGRRPAKKRAVVRTLSPQEKKRRRRVRSVVLMVSGLVVLAVAVVVLSRF